MSFQPSAHEGVLHRFSSGLVAFEHKRAINGSAATGLNLLIWVGGLGDGLLTVSYPTVLAAALPPRWTLAQTVLSSSYTGWGMSSIAQDAQELSECIGYFRKRLGEGAKIVLMGHSTGCQDAIEYVSTPSSRSLIPIRERLDGIILQAPVSDREAMLESLGKERFDAANDAAKAAGAAGRGDDVLPFSITEAFFKKQPVSARRWLSLASPHGTGADDFFSSDLPNERLEKTFGAVPIGMHVCVLYSGDDQFAPTGVDKEHLVERWRRFVVMRGGVWETEFSGVIPHATHNLDGDPDEVVNDLCRRVGGFLARVEKD